MRTLQINKNFFFLAVILLISIQSCQYFNQEKKKTNQFDKTGKLYSIEPKTTTVFWIGYKTTAKKAVKGQFTEITVKNIKKEKNPRQAIDGLEFSIPVSSLFSNNTARDEKLKKFFFGAMDHTLDLTGTLKVENDSLLTVNLKMNGMTRSIPLSYFVDGQMLSMHGKLNILDWNGGEALASLHNVCKEKHTGADGISKTWEEVGINVESYLKVE